MRSPEDFPADIRKAAFAVVARGYDEGLVEVVCRALMERDRAATERAAKMANELAETLRNQCNKSFNDGDQGSAILERTKADALDEFAAAIRSQP
jgi:uncharacterized protein (DUF2267 family)